MRRINDKIWGIWEADSLSPIIWEHLNKLIEKYGLRLDVIYDDPHFTIKDYEMIYYWTDIIN
jgi:hypothetical protein